MVNSLTFTCSAAKLTDFAMEQKLSAYCEETNMDLTREAVGYDHVKYTIEAPDTNGAFKVIQSYLTLMRELL